MERRSNADLIAAALTPDELAGEGEVTFLGAQQRPYLELCLNVKPMNKSLMMWEQPKGRSLIHVVESYANATEQASWLAANGPCLTGGAASLGGPDVRAPDGSKAMAWCYEREAIRSCGAALAEGDLLMAVVVEAESMDAAAGVVERLMPTAIRALDRA
ncbi:hypothetical protein ACFQV2_16135 [Actinokineospora soli]|uniref:Uncharacterized protein n=1 Tax=Actinokineospora soli TaxID=1048753 RepID=A0ABW2TN32_9PSEU